MLISPTPTSLFQWQCRPGARDALLLLTSSLILENGPPTSQIIDPLETSHRFQRLSIAIQRVNPIAFSNSLFRDSDGYLLGRRCYNICRLLPSLCLSVFLSV